MVLYYSYCKYWGQTRKDGLSDKHSEGVFTRSRGSVRCEIGLRYQKYLKRSVPVWGSCEKRQIPITSLASRRRVEAWFERYA